MPNQEHLSVLSKGISEWNKWRAANPGVVPELSDANLSGKDLSKGDFSRADFRNADLSNAILTGANFEKADLSGANLGGAMGLTWQGLDNR
ncbi:pentapeptide repeat-containing protein [Sphingobacteriales bacterium CHB3]|nr:pentapeptide repeat-containing protein [Sphingobacteriales bacterium CHB3]